MTAKTTTQSAKSRMLAVVDAAIKHSPMTLAAHGLDPDKFGAVIQEALLANPDVLKADEGSLARAVRKCCRDGIIPDGDQGAIIMFKDDAVAIPMVSGLLQMVVEDMDAEIRSGVVHEGDNVKITEGVGIEPKIEIESEGTDIFKSRKRTTVIGAWCWIKLPDEDNPRIVLFSEDEIARARSSSRGAQSDYSPWNKWPERMAEKACIKSAIWRIRHLARAKRNGGRLLRVVEEDNQAEYGERVIQDTAYTVEPEGEIEVKDVQATEEKPKTRKKAPAKPKQEAAPEPEQRPEPAKAPEPEPEAVQEPAPEAEAEQPADEGEGFLPDVDPDVDDDPKDPPMLDDDDPTSL